MKQTFTSHGREYEIDQFGAVHQLDAKPYKYDENYIQTYNSPEYLLESELLQSLRFSYCCLAHHGRITSILDVGYGAGQFMRYAIKYVPMVYGNDVTNVPIEGCEIVNCIELSVDVITFWDCLEHIEDLSFLEKLNCKTIVISLPFCHIHSQGNEWFDNNYIHRKPDEHLRHFDKQSLAKTMRHYGWNELVMPDYFEDIVRKPKHGLQNILTMAFKR